MLMQTATDEYIEQNEERFSEAAALLLQGREDLSAESASPSTSLSLGEHPMASHLDKNTAQQHVLLCAWLCSLCGAQEAQC